MNREAGNSDNWIVLISHVLRTGYDYLCFVGSLLHLKIFLLKKIKNCITYYNAKQKSKNITKFQE